MSADPSPDKQIWLNKIQRRLQVGLFLKSMADWVVVFCIAAGCLFLATKIFWSSSWPYMLWVLVAAVPVVAGAWWFSRRYSYQDAETVAMLDQRIGAGGLLMTVVESPDDQWESHLPAAEQVWQKAIPALVPRRAFKHLCLPLMFLIVTCLIPPRVVQSLSVSPSTVSRTEVSRLNEMLEELDENEILDEEERDEIEEEIRKLAKETKYTPLTHENWETVDALQQKMELKLANKENELQQIASAMAALQQSIKDGSRSESSDRERLEDLLQKMMESSPSSDGDDKKSGERGDQGDSEQSDLSEFSNPNGDFQLPSNAEELQAALDSLAEYMENMSDNVGEARELLKPCDCEGCKEGGT